MSSSHATLDAASTERKARLAKLASLKRKQPEPDAAPAIPTEAEPTSAAEDEESASFVTKTYLSGRNYDAETRGPKLGFESAPNEDALTLEQQANEIAQTAREQAEREEEAAEKAGIDLFKLQPKKPNWDLKRDLDKKMEVLNVRTQNAIARLVRERIQNAKKEAKAKNGATNGEAEEVGMEGNTLVEGIHQKEQEEEEDEKRERELEDEGPI